MSEIASFRCSSAPLAPPDPRRGPLSSSHSTAPSDCQCPAPYSTLLEACWGCFPHNSSYIRSHHLSTCPKSSGACRGHPECRPAWRSGSIEWSSAAGELAVARSPGPQGRSLPSHRGRQSPLWDGLSLLYTWRGRVLSAKWHQRWRQFESGAWCGRFYRGLLASMICSGTSVQQLASQIDGSAHW